MKPELFQCEDGDKWWSLVENEDIVTGVMHKTEEEAKSEAEELSAS
jgi:hypothetical protein